MKRRIRRRRAKIRDCYYYPVNYNERTIINDGKHTMSAYHADYWQWTSFCRVSGLLLNIGRMGIFKEFRIVEKSA